MDLRPSKKKMTIFLILLIIVELILFWLGAISIQCSPCAPPPAYCPPCISYDAGLYIVLLTIVPVAIIIYIILSIFSKKPKK